MMIMYVSSVTVLAVCMAAGQAQDGNTMLYRLERGQPMIQGEHLF